MDQLAEADRLALDKRLAFVRSLVRETEMMSQNLGSCYKTDLDRISNGSNFLRNLALRALEIGTPSVGSERDFSFA